MSFGQERQEDRARFRRWTRGWPLVLFSLPVIAFLLVTFATLSFQSSPPDVPGNDPDPPNDLATATELALVTARPTGAATSDIVVAGPTPDLEEDLDAAGRRMEAGLDLLAAPETGTVGQPFTLEYRVLRRAAMAPDAVATEAGGMAGGTPVAGSVGAFPVMSAEVVADPVDFRVLALSREEQAFLGQDSLAWQWRLTPLRPGRLTFSLRVSAVARAAGGDRRRDQVKSFDIEVLAGPRRGVWAGLALAALGLLWLWRRRRRPIARGSGAPASKLDGGAIAALVALIAPLADTEDERRAMVFRAFGDHPIRSAIDFEGSGQRFAAHLVETLWEHGPLADGRPALRVLLDHVRDQVGLERQARIDAVTQRLWPEEA